MAERSPAGDPDDTLSFLLDGLAARPSPVLVVVAAEDVAAQFAVTVWDGTARWSDAPAERGRLLQLTTDALAELDDARRTALLAELAQTDHWIFVPGIGALARSRAGLRFLSGLVRAVADGDLTAVVASTDRADLDQLRRAAPRLMGFATTLADGERTSTTSMVVPIGDSSDAGWVVAVRYALAGPVDTDGGAGAEAALAGSLELVERIQLVDLPDRPPAGVVISLRPDAFTLSQEDAALATAAVVARRVVGRDLRAGESVTPTRSLYYG